MQALVLRQDWASTYCKEFCRRKEIVTSEKFKMRRRQYMKEYRVREKEADLAAARSVKLGRKER
jgi:hypothetical protein